MDETTETRNVLYEVFVRYTDYPADHIKNVEAWRLEDEVYFFFVKSFLDPKIPAIQTFWVKNPNVISINIVPVKFAD
jgi:hypothetical protein